MVDLPQQPTQTGETDGTSYVHEDNELEDLLEAVSDSECRKIIQQTQHDTLSAKELSDRCDIPLSTVYRKLETLVDVGILEEQRRIRACGQFPAEYTLRAESISIELVDDSGVSLALTQRTESDSETNRSTQELSAD